MAQISTVGPCCGFCVPGLLSVPVLEGTADLGQYPVLATTELFRIASLRIIFFFLNQSDL